MEMNVMTERKACTVGSVDRTAALRSPCWWIHSRTDSRKCPEQPWHLSTNTDLL